MNGLRGLDSWLTSPPEEPDWLEIAEKRLKTQPKDEYEGEVHEILHGLLVYLDEAEEADHTPHIVYILIGETGAWGDHTTWVCKTSYLNRSQADDVCKLFNEQAAMLYEIEQNACTEEEFDMMPAHPDLCFRMYGTPTVYTVIDLEVEGE